MGSPKGKQPLRLVGIMFDEDNKMVSFSSKIPGFDVHYVASGSDYYHARHRRDGPQHGLHGILPSSETKAK
jgi:hypothetical protein